MIQSEDLRNYFLFQDERRFTEERLEQIEKHVGNPLPQSYRDFALKYGGVSINDRTKKKWYESRNLEYSQFDFPEHCWAQFRIGSQTENRRVFVRDFLTWVQVEESYLDFTVGPIFDDVDFFFPKFLVPIARDSGDSYFLVETGSDKERIFFWERSDDQWGTGSNTMVGFVAKDVYELINNLEYP